MRPDKVLLVDDEEDFLEVLGERLRRRGLEVRTATNGPDAIGLARDEPFDAVVLDLAMPDLDGHETLLEMRSLRPGLPVVLVSGFREDASTGRFASEEITAFVRKPYEPEELIEAVRASLADPPGSGDGPS